MPRRLALAGLLAGLSPPLAAAPRLPDAMPAAEWNSFRQRYVASDGRVIDNGNRGISHSEGQGAGMLFAARQGDRASFERILDWTRRRLSRPSDSLHAWRFVPGATLPVADPNNATDGDLLIAWALLEAHERWNDPGHRRMALAIGRDVLRLCTLRQGERLLLLPGAQGFVLTDLVVVNPSYWCFGALDALESATGDAAWAALHREGLALLRRARFGRWGLPADWVRLPRGEGPPTAAPPWPHRFSWDAIRVPLYLVWAGHEDEPAVQAAARFWRDPSHRVLPAWVDLGTGYVAPYPASPAIRGLAALAVGPARSAVLPAASEARDYYSAKLLLMAGLARADVARRSVLAARSLLR